MLNFRQFVRPLIPVGVVVLLCLTAAPTAEANNGTPTTTSQKTTTTGTTGQQDDKQKKPAPPKPTSQKSVLDADILERPLSFFKNSFSPEEDEDTDDMFSHSSTVVIAVKALIASLLSTII